MTSTNTKIAIAVAIGGAGYFLYSAMSPPPVHKVVKNPEMNFVYDSTVLFTPEMWNDVALNRKYWLNRWQDPNYKKGEPIRYSDAARLKLNTFEYEKAFAKAHPYN